MAPQMEYHPVHLQAWQPYEPALFPTGSSARGCSSPSTSAIRVLVFVAQVAGELKVLLSATIVSHQQTDQTAAVGGTAAGGVGFNRALKSASAGSRFPLNRCALPRVK